MKFDSKHQAFFALVKAGLWEKDVLLSTFNKIEYQEINRLAEEQAVVGLVAAGLEHVTDVIVPKEDLLQFAGQALQLEQRNKAMNEFVAKIISLLRKNGVYVLLIKGQGIAQCYEKPLWRSCGDIDLLMDEKNYEKAKSVLMPLSISVEDEEKDRLHLGMVIDGWVVELHGTLYSRLKKSINKELRSLQEDTFNNGKVRVWINNTDIYLPEPNNDLVFVFTHIIQHYFKGGIGLRQICDWCRLIWRYHSELNIKILEERIKRMGLLSEWKVFASLVVNHLGMPENLMPLYDMAKKWKNKANRVMSFILKVGNFGHNRDASYYDKYPYLIYKMISLGRHISDFSRYVSVFPIDTLYVSLSTIGQGLKTINSGK